MRRLLVAIATIAVIALVAGAVAWRQRGEATDSRRAADLAAREATTQRDAATNAATDAQHQRQSALDAAFAADTERMAAIAPTLAKTDPSLGMLVAAEANRRTNAPATLGALQDVLAADTTLGYIRPGATSKLKYTMQDVGYDTAGNIVTFGGTSQDGRSNQEIVVWDGRTHERLRDISVPSPPISDFATHSAAIGGGEAAWIDDQHELWVADLTTGEIVDRGASGGSGIAIHDPSHRIVVVTGNGEVLAYDHGQNTPRWRSTGDTANSGTPADIVFNKSGTKVYISRAQGVRAFDMNTGDLLGSIDYVAPNKVREFVAPLDSDDTKVIIGNTFAPVLGDIDDGTYAQIPFPLANLDPVTIVPIGGDRHAELDFRGSVVISDPAGDRLLGPIQLNLGRTWAAALAPDGRTMVVGGDSGAAVVALDSSNLIRKTLPSPPDYQNFVAISDRLMYTDPSTFDPFNIVTGTYWDCASTCDEWKGLPRGTSEIPYPEVNGWIPVVEFKADGPPQWKIYDEHGNLHASGPSVPGYTLIRSAFVPKSGAWFATFSVDAQFQGTLEVRSLPDWTPLLPPTTISVTAVGTFLNFAGVAEPDQLLVVDEYGGELQLLDTTTWKMTPASASLAFHEVGSAAFSADGRMLVTASTSGDIAIRDATTFETRKTLSGAVALSNVVAGSSLAISDDSSLLLTALDGGARLWDVVSGEPIGNPVGDPVDFQLKNPTYTQVVGGARPAYLALHNGTVQVWHFDVDHYREMACQAAGRNMTREEWKRYGPRDQPYHSTCEQWTSE